MADRFTTGLATLYESASYTPLTGRIFMRFTAYEIVYLINGTDGYVHIESRTHRYKRNYAYLPSGKTMILWHKQLITAVPLSQDGLLGMTRRDIGIIIDLGGAAYLKSAAVE